MKGQLNSITSIRFFAAVLPVFFFYAAISSQQVYAQDVQKIEIRSRKGSGTRDRNIGKPKPPSGAKGGAVCTISLINPTRHVVSLYVNDRIAPLTATLDKPSQARVETGRLKIYARTDRIGRNFLYWGPTNATCGTETKDGQIEMKIESDPVL